MWLGWHHPYGIFAKWILGSQGVDIERKQSRRGICRWIRTGSDPHCLRWCSSVQYCTTGSEAFTSTAGGPVLGTTKAETKVEDSKAAALVKPRMVATVGLAGRRR